MKMSVPIPKSPARIQTGRAGTEKNKKGPGRSSLV